VERGEEFPLNGFKFILAAGELSLCFVCVLIATASIGKRCSEKANFMGGGAAEHSTEDFRMDMQIVQGHSDLTVPLVLSAVYPLPIEARPLTFLARLRRGRGNKQASGAMSMDRFTVEH
jgi:hypothetical protein